MLLRKRAKLLRRLRAIERRLSLPAKDELD